MIDDNFIFPFGKYKGKKIGEIPASYLFWIEDNIESLDPKIKEYINENRSFLDEEMRYKNSVSERNRKYND